MGEEQPRDNPAKQRFELQIGASTAIADYRLSGRTIEFTHTEVPPPLEGAGVGSRLIRFALDEARQRGYRVRPSCRFVEVYIRRHPEYADLVD
jgi:predicted GNAT family acetyltransferase